MMKTKEKYIYLQGSDYPNDPPYFFYYSNLQGVSLNKILLVSSWPCPTVLLEYMYPTRNFLLPSQDFFYFESSTPICMMF